ncbi:polysaccharide deacetylase family protein [Cytobacillus sp. FJAT-54145]|uniref:Polysaccharide deacetylase family protein n=1 Tax=Cytobacillus spartinae TaxID=3299023 RepID=A0ABW6KHH7_9BACI
MKNIFYIALLLSLILIGCSQEEVSMPIKEEGSDNKVEPTIETKEDVQAGSTESGSKEEIEEVNVEQREAEYKVNQSNWLIEPTGTANDQVVLLTIDDAPQQYALEMAKTLDNLGVKAIFFVNGHFIDTEEEAKILKEIYDLGFPIGNHTYSHHSLKDLTEEEQYDQIVSLNNRIKEIIGEKPKFFRAPFGANTEYSKKVVEQEKMVLMNWTYGYDWEKDFQTKESLVDIMVNTPLLMKGANLLMHDREWTNAALEDIVKGLRAKGFEIVDPGLIETPK